MGSEISLTSLDRDLGERFKPIRRELGVEGAELVLERDVPARVRPNLRRQDIPFPEDL
jgi:hypothetical protein